VFVVSGVPQTWRPDSVYDITLTIRASGVHVGGFQLSTRFLGGSQHGRQAGTLASLDERVALDIVHATGVSYAQHARAAEASADSSITWTVRWSAPRDGGDVAVDFAVNAANGDASPFGDRIFTRRIVIGATDTLSRGLRRPSDGSKKR